ncbi:hypothetical protein ACFUAG_20085 [Streptomyces sp. NPDC057193]
MTALVAALFLLVAGVTLGPFLLRPPTRAAAPEILMAGARRLVTLERARRSAFFGDRFSVLDKLDLSPASGYSGGSWRCSAIWRRRPAHGPGAARRAVGWGVSRPDVVTTTAARAWELLGD